jgi:hypothetical protein
VTPTPPPDNIVELTAADPRDDSLTSPPRRLLVTPEEGASMLRIGRSSMYGLMNAGRIAYVHINASRRIPVAVLEAFVKELLDNETDQERPGEAGPPPPGPLAS